MRIIRLLKPVLLIQEILRIVVIVILLLMRSDDTSTFTMLILAAQGALFPLMALFLCLNTERYREYLPLYIAGKSIGIVLLLYWSLLTQQVTMIEGLISERLILIIDLAVILILVLIKKDVKTMTLDSGKQITTDVQDENERLKQLKRLKRLKRFKQLKRR